MESSETERNGGGLSTYNVLDTTKAKWNVAPAEWSGGGNNSKVLCDEGQI